MGEIRKIQCKPVLKIKSQSDRPGGIWFASGVAGRCQTPWPLKTRVMVLKINQIGLLRMADG